MGNVEELEKLQKLKESGVINDSEFEVEKARILNNVTKLEAKSSFSIASAVCGGVSVFVFPYIFGIAAIILGIVGIVGISRQEKNKNSAIAGIIIGIIGIIWALIYYGIIEF